MFKNPDFADRLSSAAHAKMALLEKFRTQPGVNDPAFAEREAIRRATRIARDARAADRKAVREAQEAVRQAAQAALDAELAARQALEMHEAAEQAAREVALDAERKAARDARYAARKARKK